MKLKKGLPKMAADLIVKGGLIADGTGLPVYRADIVVEGGRIRSIGRTNEPAKEVIDADGLIVAPGFIDLHTHYDAQVHFEPLATPSSWHGVTTVVGGQCGFSLAPSSPQDLPWLTKMLSRVEGMSPAALAAGVDFAGGGIGDFLGNLDGRLGINFGMFAGHAAIRRSVMGEAASERAATSGEIQSMVKALRVAIREGALGFSSSQLLIHSDHMGRPVPPNLANRDELVALAGVLAEHDQGMIGFFPETMGEGYGDADRALMLAMSEASGFKPFIANPLTLYSSRPDAHHVALEFLDEARANGHRIHPQFMMPMLGMVWDLASTFIFDEMEIFRTTLALEGEERLEALMNPEIRRQMKATLANPAGRMVQFDWTKTRVAKVDEKNAQFLNRSVQELADELGKDPLDVVLDLAVSEELRTVFSKNGEVDASTWGATRMMIEHPLPLAGSSDGGAHLQSFCGGDYTTRLLIDAVPEVLTLEQAVSRLSYQPAILAGLWDRGSIRPGNVADLVIFDPAKLGVGSLEFREDFPADTSRVVIDAEGYRALIVSGEVVLRDGQDTGARPGIALRHQGHTIG
jgi:N-acyl-D-aspartate/D-glutamate deacylase